MQPLNRHPRICPAGKYRLGLRYGCKTGGNRLFDTVADRDIGKVTQIEATEAQKMTKEILNTLV